MKTKIDYNKLFNDIAQNKISKKERLRVYKHLAKTDLYFLIRYIFNREDIEHQWLYDLIQMVEKKNNNVVYLLPRGHYKTTVITKAYTIQYLLNNPSHTICIFSHTNEIALSFLRSIKNILKTCDLLRILFSDIIPQPNDTSHLSEEKIRLLTNKSRQENSIDASGLVDGQPTGMHYDLRIYDDIVVPESVSTPDQIKKLQKMFELSHNLSSRINRMVIVGTRYHHADLFSDLKEKNIYEIIKIPAIQDGVPVFLTKEEIEKKRREMGSYVFACQMMLDPSEDDASSIFSSIRFNYWDELPAFKNTAILVDPAIAKNGCYSVIMLTGITEDHKIYVIDYISAVGLKPQEQVDAIYKLYTKYNPRHIAIEQVGYQQALKYITEDYFRLKNKIINVEELKPHKSKNERIVALQPYFENNQIILKYGMKELETEIKEYPYSKYRDHIDVLAYAPIFFKPLKIEHTQIIGNIDRLKKLKYNKIDRINKYKRGNTRWTINRYHH